MLGSLLKGLSSTRISSVRQLTPNRLLLSTLKGPVPVEELLQSFQDSKIHRLQVPTSLINVRSFSSVTKNPYSKKRVKALLQDKGINWVCENGLALIADSAIRANSYELTAGFLLEGADPAIKDRLNQENIVHLAARSNHGEVIFALNLYSSNPKIFYDKNVAGDTPLIVAINSGSYDAAHQIIMAMIEKCRAAYDKYTFDNNNFNIALEMHELLKLTFESVEDAKTELEKKPKNEFSNSLLSDIERLTKLELFKDINDIYESLKSKIPAYLREKRIDKEAAEHAKKTAPNKKNITPYHIDVVKIRKEIEARRELELQKELVSEKKPNSAIQEYVLQRVVEEQVDKLKPPAVANNPVFSLEKSQFRKFDSISL